MRHAVLKLASGVALASAAVLALTGAAGETVDSFDVRTQIGPNPVLPALQQYLLPPMHLAPVIGWKPGETPKVPSSLHIQALATGLEHPRSVYTLPNGDVLVVESRGPGIEPAARQ
jgi:glucose/arabinose dehydrogenase